MVAMKKLLLFAAAAAMFAACSTDTTEDIAVLPDGILRVSFSEDDSRVQLDENSRTVWNEGDLISVFNKTTSNECWQFDGKTGDSVGTISKVSGSAGGSAIGKIFAVYPYAEYNAVSADGTITTEIPATQKYCADSYGVGNNIMVASSESGDLAFKNVLGWIKIRLSGTETVKSLVLEGNDGETLAGAATVDAGLAVSLAADAAKSLTLDCGEGVALSSDPTAFYFAVVPQVFEKGITVTAHYSDGSTFEKSTDKAITVERNHIVPMAEIVSSVPDDEIWYKTSNNTVYDVLYTVQTYGHQPFDANVISNTYQNGYGIIKFDAPVKKINDYTFGTTNITELYLPDCIEYFGIGALQNIGVSTLYIPKNLKCVESYAINSSTIEKFIGNNISEDGKCVIIDKTVYAFASKGIKEYTIPDYVESISDYAFWKSPELETVTFNERLQYIGSCVFESCDKLKSVILPKNLQKIGFYAFKDCNNIEGFYGNVKFVSDDNRCLFSYNYAGTDLEGKWLDKFSGGKLTEYIIPNDVTGIQNYAFENNHNLQKLTLPHTIKYFSGAAITNCTKMEYLYGDCTSDDHKCIIINEELQFFLGNGIKEYIIPNNISSIGDFVFKDNKELQKLVISDNVTRIGYNALDNLDLKTLTLSANLESTCPIYCCQYLESVYCRSLIPPHILYNVPPTEFDTFTIYVPQQSLNLYLNSSDWQPYRKYIVGYEYTDLPEPDYYISSDYSADGTVRTLQKATVGRGIDIILMGDAFSDRQIAAGDYDTAMRQAADNMFTEEPYKSFRDMFNVYAVTAVSATEGYEHENTAFSGYFGGGTLVGGNDAKVFEYVQKAIAAERMDDALIVVMMNSQAYAGTCYMYYPSSNSDYGHGVSVAYFPLGTDNDMFAQLLHHEACGHGFAKLDDEYAYEYMGAVSAETVAQHNQLTPYGWYKNTDFTSDPATVKWHTFLSDPRYANDGLGVFEGGATYWTGVWRPTENSIMRYNTGGFNAPSREAIYYRIHKLAYDESWNYDYEDFVAYDAVNRKATAGISLSTPIVPKDFVPLAPPVVVGKSWRDAR